MEIKLKKEDLIFWLQTVSGATILSIALVGQVDRLTTNICSPIKLAMAFKQNVPFLDEGPYLVKYEQSENNQDGDSSYSTFAMAITVKAKLAKGDRFIGGYDNLMRALNGYEFLSKIKKEPYGLVGHLLIALPQDPNEIDSLHDILSTNSVMYAFPDGTFSLHLGNLRMGNGIYS